MEDIDAPSERSPKRQKLNDQETELPIDVVQNDLVHALQRLTSHDELTRNIHSTIDQAVKVLEKQKEHLVKTAVDQFTDLSFLIMLQLFNASNNASSASVLTEDTENNTMQEDVPNISENASSSSSMDQNREDHKPHDPTLQTLSKYSDYVSRTIDAPCFSILKVFFFLK